MSPRARNRLKQIIMLLWVIFLLVDLAQDGLLAKGRPANLLCQGTIYQTFSPDSSGKVGSSVWITSARLPDIPQGWLTQSVSVEIESPLPIIKCYFRSSSGGIPL